MKTNTAIIIFAFAWVSLSSISVDAAPPEKSSLKIFLSNDSITVSIDDRPGTGFKTAIDSIPKIITTGIPGANIENELVIDGNKIIIDGKQFFFEDVKRFRVTRSGKYGVTISAGLPFQKFRKKETTVADIDLEEPSTKVSVSDLTIASGEVIEGNAVAVTGDIKVYGKITEDVVSLFGDIYLFDGSSIGGNVVAPFGKIFAYDKPRISGQCIGRNHQVEKTRTLNLDFSFRYNRVEGFTPLIKVDFADKENELPEIESGFGYAFALKRWDLLFGFKQAIGAIGRPYFGARTYRGAFTPDLANFTYGENTLAGLLFKEDFHDFYFRRGWQGYIGADLGRGDFIQIEYTVQKNEAIDKRTNWSIFGRGKNFRENYSSVLPDSAPIIGMDGKHKKLGLRVVWDDLPENKTGRSGNRLGILLESAGKGSIGGLGGDFSYEILEIEALRYQPISPSQYLGIRLKTAYSDQELPLDRWLFLGGEGTIRGYEFKEFAGNRMLLLNVDYYWKFSKEFSMAVFADFGQAGFGEREFAEMGLKPGIGVGFLMEDFLRLNISQRLDDTDKSPVISARTEMRF